MQKILLYGGGVPCLADVFVPSLCQRHYPWSQATSIYFVIFWVNNKAQNKSYFYVVSIYSYVHLTFWVNNTAHTKNRYSKCERYFCVVVSTYLSNLSGKARNKVQKVVSREETKSVVSSYHIYPLYLGKVKAHNKVQEVKASINIKKKKVQRVYHITSSYIIHVMYHTMYVRT